MREITEDAWDEEIWGASVQGSTSTRAKLVFYFGQSDHWVADRTRDDLIRARAFKADQSHEWKPRMIIDEDGIPHGFCISRSLTTGPAAEADMWYRTQRSASTESSEIRQGNHC